MLLVRNLEAKKIQTVFSIWKLNQLTKKKFKKQAKKKNTKSRTNKRIWTKTVNNQITPTEDLT